ncbi:alpha/beta hydrolase family protein [Niallia circulans]|uniref:S9 family peptidase n=1 Tax=Niallia circulans TaxID=1397 RepID=A0A941JLP3_NIACI|nr:S9 family peptidase [Niallia circulans]MCB5236651.1 S9 family peptidase [Niallia circulans]
MEVKESKRINAEDLYELKSVVDPQVNGIGQECLYVLTSICKETDKYYSNIFHKNLNTLETSQWTFGKDRNHSPRWSPNGEQVVFISNRSGKNQLFLLSKKGGEAKQLTYLVNGVSNPVWSPDGKEIAFQSNFKTGETVADKESKKEDKEDNLTALEVTNMKYKSDGKGFWDGSYDHIAVIDIESGNMEQLTTGDNNYYLQSWSPDGQYIAISADQNKEKDFSFISDIYLYNRKEKNWKRITESNGNYGKVTWTPDSKRIGLIGSDREYENATLSKLWVYDLESDFLQCLTPEWDVNVGDYAIGDFQQGVVTPGMLWGEDNESFTFLASDHGNTVVYFGNISGAVYPSLIDNQHVYGLSTGGSLKKAVVAISTPTHPGDLYTLDLETGEIQQITEVNKGFAESHAFSEAEPLQFASRDGWELHGWLMKPQGFKEGEKYPLVLEIHGGPHAMYANSYFHEFQTLASNGFAVLFINPRGSHGYGQQFVDAVRGDYGGKDYEDIMDAVDYCLETFNFIDSSRLGVTGGSYGGFMTNWIVGHTDRFKAAVTQRSISNWISFYGVSDIGYYFADWQIKADLNDIETLWKHSPLAYVKNIKTPLLILHGEKDYRCPIEQAEQLFIALKIQKKETKFVRFPESNHELSRSGKPALRIERLNYINNWFLEYV